MVPPGQEGKVKPQADADEVKQLSELRQTRAAVTSESGVAGPVKP